MVDLLIGTHRLINGRVNDTNIPYYQSFLSKSLHKSIFLQKMFDQSCNSVRKAVFITPIAEFDINMISRPVLEDKVANSYLLYCISFANIGEKIVAIHVLLQFLFQLLLLVEILLLGLILFLHFLQSLRVYCIKIRKIFNLCLLLSCSYLGRYKRFLMMFRFLLSFGYPLRV